MERNDDSEKQYVFTESMTQTWTRNPLDLIIKLMLSPEMQYYSPKAVVLFCKITQKPSDKNIKRWRSKIKNSFNFDKIIISKKINRIIFTCLSKKYGSNFRLR